MCPVWITRLWVPFQPITAPYLTLLIKPRIFAKRQCKLQWLTPPTVAPLLLPRGAGSGTVQTRSPLIFLRLWAQASPFSFKKGKQLFVQRSAQEGTPRVNQIKPSQSLPTIYTRYSCSVCWYYDQVTETTELFSLFSLFWKNPEAHFFTIFWLTPLQNSQKRVKTVRFQILPKSRWNLRNKFSCGVNHFGMSWPCKFRFNSWFWGVRFRLRLWVYVLYPQESKRQ